MDKLIEERAPLERRQLLILAGGGLGIAVVAFIITAFATGGIVAGSSGPDRIAFHYTDATSEQLPLTSDLAAAAGWSGSILCVLGKGRFYQKATADGPYPLMLMYGPEGDLVGIQIHSLTAQPAPLWEHWPEGVEVSTVENMKFEHWRLGLYIVKPVLSCGIRTANKCVTCYG